MLKLKTASAGLPGPSRPAGASSPESVVVPLDIASPVTIGALQAEIGRLTEALAHVERDRQFLGYDIHDGVVQDLTAAAMLLEGASKQATFCSDESKSNYEGGLRLLREGIAEARRLIRGLALVELDERGIAPALARLVEKFRTELMLPVTLVAAAEVPLLPASMQHLLLRITQEALFNVWKHASATNIEVSLVRGEETLDLVIADNGVGFDPAKVPSGHFGLDGIRARARVLGATLIFDTAPEHGTRVVVQLPLTGLGAGD
jgi:signal transduction histidine kinase